MALGAYFDRSLQEKRAAEERARAFPLVRAAVGAFTMAAKALDVEKEVPAEPELEYELPDLPQARLQEEKWTVTPPPAGRTRGRPKPSPGESTRSAQPPAPSRSRKPTPTGSPSSPEA